MTHPRPRDLALVVAAGVLWGTGGLSGAALANQGLGPLSVGTYRLGVGGVLLLVGLAVAGRLHRVPLTRPALVRIAVTGALAAVYQAAYFAAVSLGSVSVATLVALGASPVMVAGLTAALDRTAPPPRVVVAIGLALGGLVLLLGAPAGGSEPLLGALLALVPGAAFAVLTVVNRTPATGLGALELTGVSFTFGAVLLAPFAIVVGGGWRPAGGVGVALLVWLGLGPTAMAYSAYFSGLRTVPSTTASLIVLLEPLTATVGAALLLGERMTPLGLLGGALLVAGILVGRVAPTMAVGPRRPTFGRL
ncbi:DMT family transporter [Actinotalea sp. M2MS4P-6]|uniref:DMT family transporter n=1 Tax=Actinotalea sp. M2MS4P-6 TaxID=2983762 RepID=UPI0021E49788|nr:DMT family transporter [Actinotalea sp. M2MS4P-6]MCV2394140.1 DMT family transporter [Actinotalea sp. M2MS4P-6]